MNNGCFKILAAFVFGFAFMRLWPPAMSSLQEEPTTFHAQSPAESDTDKQRSSALSDSPEILLKRLRRSGMPSTENLQLEEQWLQQIASENPYKFLELVREGMVSSEAVELLRSVVRQLATTSSGDVVARELATLPVGWAKTAAWLELAATAAVCAEPEKAWDHADLAGTLASRYKIALATEWAEWAPENAIRHANAHMTMWERNRFLYHHSKVVDRWLARDPVGALEWLDSDELPKRERDSLRFHALFANAERWAELSEPAREILNPYWQDPRMLASREAAILREQAREAPDKAFNDAIRIDHLGSWGSRRVVKAVLEEVRQSDPETALALSLEVPNQVVRREVIYEHAASQATASPQDVHDWAIGLSDEVSRQAAIDGMMGQWLKDDLEAATDALAALPESLRSTDSLESAWYRFRVLKETSQEQRQAAEQLWARLSTEQRQQSAKRIPSWLASSNQSE